MQKYHPDNPYYPVKLRRITIQQIEAELLTEKQACEKLSISTNLLRKWRQQYYQRHLSPHINPKSMKKKKDKDQQIKALKEQVAALQKQNKQLQVEAYAHKTMVDIAEKELNIPIRKKSGPKQSHK